MDRWGRSRGAIWNALKVVGLNVDSLIFDNVTFRNYAATATQFTINHSGASVTFNNLIFLTPPPPGFYIAATDTDVGNETPLEIILLNPQPDDGSARTQTGGGASVFWGGGIPM